MALHPEIKKAFEGAGCGRAKMGKPMPGRNVQFGTGKAYGDFYGVAS